MNQNPIICALDTSSEQQALKWIDLVQSYVGMFKVGLELFTANGLPFLGLLASKNIPVFLDLKFYDIPNTVYKTIQNFNKFKNIKMLTVHGSGDPEMISAAVEAASHIEVIAVTVLTSSKSKGWTDVVARKITEKSLAAGATGVVCSRDEIKFLREKIGNEFKIIVPGVRPAWYKTADDQSRTGTPKEILDRGATHLVVGRPITLQNDMREAASKILNEIKV